jgi:hypothetical protein
MLLGKSPGLVTNDLLVLMLLIVWYAVHNVGGWGHTVITTRKYNALMHDNSEFGIFPALKTTETSKLGSPPRISYCLRVCAASESISVEVSLHDGWRYFQGAFCLQHGRLGD